MEQNDLFAPKHAAIAVLEAQPELFTGEFLAYLPENLHVWDAFEREALKVVRRGFSHYSARTILHVLRHHSALEENGSQWKLNNNVSPYLARVFDLVHPDHAGLFEYRETKAVKRQRGLDA